MRWTALLAALACTTLAAAAAPARAAEVFDPARGVLLKGTVVTMVEKPDGSFTVVTNGNVLVRNGVIVAVWQGSTPPPPVNVGNAQVVDVGPTGLIYPGMINAHSHTAYNMLPIWPAPSSDTQSSQGRPTGTEPYSNRYQWTDPDEYGRLVNGPKKALTEAKYLNLAAEVVKYAETKAMLGGETAFQGTPSLSATNFMLVRNIENTTFGRDRISQRGLSIDDTRWTATLETGLLQQIREGKVDAWIVHLAEGLGDADRPPTSFDNRGEFDRLRGLGLLTDVTCIIHGTGLDEVTHGDFTAMRNARSIRADGQGDGLGAKLIWSPLSNLLLYGKTTKVYHALAAGVTVSLGTDWSPSGSKNLLGELKVADIALRDARILGGDRTLVPALASESALDRALVAMVTINPARMLRWTNEVGSIQAGKIADLFVITKPDGSPLRAGIPDSVYRSLIDATERDVRLVMIGGDPVAGDPEVMQDLKPGDNEVVTSARGHFAKAVDVTKSGVVKGDQTFGYIRRTLEEALAALGGDTPPAGGGPPPNGSMYSYLKSRFSGTATMSDPNFETFLKSAFHDVAVGNERRLNLEKMVLDPALVEDDDFLFHVLRGDATGGFINDGTPPFQLYPSNINHPAAAFDLASFENRWYGYLGGLAPTPPTPAASIAQIEAFVNSVASDRVRFLDEDVGLTNADAQAVVALVDQAGTFTRTQLIGAIGLGDAVYLERKTADYIAAQQPPPDLATDTVTLAFVNHPTTTVAVLTSKGISSSAASSLVARRNGPDGRFGTTDDRPFVDSDGPSGASGFGDIDSAAWVGPATILALQKAAFGFTAPAPPPGPVTNTQLLLSFLNAETTTLAILTKPAAELGPGLSSTAARAILSHRNGPDGRFGTSDDDKFDTLKEVDDVYGVGIATMQALEKFAASVLAPSPVPKLVQLMNLTCVTASYLQAKITGLTSLQASNLIAARTARGGTFTSVDQIDAVSQIGAVTMQKLTTFAEALPNPVLSCPP